MKKSLTLFMLTFYIQLFANELSWVDEQVEAIKPPRSGVSSQLLRAAENPFIFLKKEEKKENLGSVKTGKALPATISPLQKPKKKSESFTLWLVVNKMAKINDAWYKEGATIHGYKVEKIEPKSVLLTKKKKRLLLSTRSNSTKLKFKNK